MKTGKQKRILRAIFALACILASGLIVPACSLTARADVILGPDETNEFYLKNRDSMKDHIYRPVYALEETECFEAPGDRKSVVTLAAGKEIFLFAIYQDEEGTWWGFSEDSRSRGHGGTYGSWFLLEKMALVYGEDEFADDYADRIYRDERIEFQEGEEIVVYSYPCSDHYSKMTIRKTEGNSARKFFEDDEGRIWAYLTDRGFYTSKAYRYRRSWVCLDDPKGEDIGEDNYEKVISALTLTEKQKGRAGAGAPDGSGTGNAGGGAALSPGILIGAAVALLIIWAVAVAAVVVIIRRRKKRTGNQ